MLLGFIFLVLLALSGGSNKSRANTKPLVKLVGSRHVTPKQLRAGARYASLIGYSRAALALGERAEFLENVAKVVTLIGGETGRRPKTASPWPDVDGAQWRDYLKASVPDLSECEGREWLVGSFGLHPRLLQKLGLMADVVRDGGGWSGRWAGTLPRAAFVQSLPAQVQAMTAISSLHRDECGGTLERMSGQEFQGERASLSGLLAVARLAGGCHGLDSWCSNEADRGKFKATTAAYLRSNGIF